MVGRGAFHRRLFLTHEYLHGGAGEIPVVADFILQETAVGLLYPLGEITEEHESRDYGTLELGDVFDFDIFTFVRRRGIGSDCLEHHFVELRGGHFAAAVFVDINRCLKHLEDALLCQSRAEDDGEIGERGEAGADGFLEMLLSVKRFVFGYIPFVDADNQSFPVALNQSEYVGVLCLDSACGIDHEDAHVRSFYGTDGAYYGIVFYILVDFLLFADACGVDQIEVKAIFVVACVDAVACGAGDIGDDMAVLTDESVYQR